MDFLTELWKVRCTCIHIVLYLHGLMFYTFCYKIHYVIFINNELWCNFFQTINHDKFPLQYKIIFYFQLFIFFSRNFEVNNFEFFWFLDFNISIVIKLSKCIPIPDLPIFGAKAEQKWNDKGRNNESNDDEFHAILFHLSFSHVIRSKYCIFNLKFNILHFNKGVFLFRYFGIKA